MSNPTHIESETYRGFEIEIHVDEMPMSPREWDNVGPIIGNEDRDVFLGDEMHGEYFRDGAREHLVDLFMEFIPKDHTVRKGLKFWYPGDLDSWGEYFDDNLTEDEYDPGSAGPGRENFGFEVAMREYDKHVGQAIDFTPTIGFTYRSHGCQCAVRYSRGFDWETDDAFSYCTLETARREWGKPDSTWETEVGYGGEKITLREAAYRMLEVEAWEYAQYAEGNCYGYIIKDPDDCEIEDGSVWGYYGHDNEKSGLMDSARWDIDAHIRRERQAHFNQLREWSRHRVPLGKREPLPLELAA